jgi:hypothetical protein
LYVALDGALPPTPTVGSDPAALASTATMPPAVSSNPNDAAVQRRADDNILEPPRRITVDPDNEDFAAN